MKETVVRFRCSHAEKDHWQKEADAQDLSLSDYLRQYLPYEDGPVKLTPEEEAGLLDNERVVQATPAPRSWSRPAPSTSSCAASRSRPRPSSSATPTASSTSARS